MIKKKTTGRPRAFSQKIRAQSVHFQQTSITRLLPNVATVIALCTGLSAIRFSLLGKHDYALTAIIIAAFFDAMDGRLARLLGAASDFGAELDSLSDFVSFGVSPAVMLYIISLQTWGGLGWSFSLIFAVCHGLRLARFNTHLRALDPQQPEPVWRKDFFIGVPVPASALIALLPLEFFLATEATLFLHPFFCILSLLLAGILSVSRLPTYSLKNVHISRPMVLPVMVMVGGTVAALLSQPWITLSVMVLLYLISLPFSYQSYQKKEQAQQTAVLTTAS